MTKEQEKQAIIDMLTDCTKRAAMALDSLNNGDLDKVGVRVSQLKESFNRADKAFTKFRDYNALKAE